jgi:hypothetical protein
MGGTLIQNRTEPVNEPGSSIDVIKFLLAG